MSVDHANFDVLKSFLADLVLQLAVDSGRTRVGLVTYAGSADERFNLTRYTRRDDLSSTISALPYLMSGGYDTRTADAIASVRQVCVCIAISTVPNLSALRSAARGDLVVPRTRLQLGNRAFCVALWPGRMEQSTTAHSFGTYIINFQKHAQDTYVLSFLLH